MLTESMEPEEQDELLHDQAVFLRKIKAISKQLTLTKEEITQTPVIENNLITGMLKVSLDRRPDAAPLLIHRHNVKLLKDAYIRIEKEELEALKGIE
mgnify:CR=1 FL=1